MTQHSEVDPVVLAGEPGSVHQLEGGDDDLPLVADDAVPDAPAAAPGRPRPPQAPTGRSARQQQEWAAADRVVDASPTALGE
jgi:hypothetical protein